LLNEQEAPTLDGLGTAVAQNVLPKILDGVPSLPSMEPSAGHGYGHAGRN
jgi:hypothetical protein